jgi:hypothetical protein
MSTWSWKKLALISIALPLFGCAEEREPISRVQSNALKKEFFVGQRLQDPGDDPEFYAAATVIDVPYGVDHGLFSGLAGGLKRLKWEISESRLLGRASYETIEGVDGRGSRTTNNGQVIAAFPILSHFDIKRAYNPSTGEELNVLEENTSDRPWYEREYMRVDWATNLVTSSIWWDPLSQNSLFGGDTYRVEPVAYYVSDPEHPDAPVFVEEDHYFDITQKLFVTPKTITLEGSTYPTCLLRGVWVASGNGETGVCESSEIKIRMSFRKVAEPGEKWFTDYEPLHWDGARMDAFGIFTQDRLGYDNHYGVVDDKWYRFAQRYNIWFESHKRGADGNYIACGLDATHERGDDPKRDVNPQDGTDDECAAAGPGSRCNVITRKCTVPYAERQIRPVAWHHHMMNDDEVIRHWSQLATEEWDVALRLAVQAARQVECQRTGGQSIARKLETGEWAHPLWKNEYDKGGEPAEACKRVFPIGQGEEEELKNVQRVLRCRDKNGRDAAECAADPLGVASMQAVVVFCHNPVRGPEPGVYAGDDPACGPPGLVTRTGDIRYHSMNNWPTPENSSPWGFGPSWSDPLTGEIIQASINVYNTVTDVSAQGVIDQALWYAGELPTSSVADGTYVRDWVAAKESPTLDRAPQMSREGIDQRLLGMSHIDPQALAEAETLRQKPEILAIDRQLKDHMRLNRQMPTVAGANAAEFQTRINMAKGTPIEAALTGPMWLEAAALHPETSLSQDVVGAASPLRLLNARNMMNLEEAVQRQMARNGMCLYEADAPEPSSVVAIGKLLKNKFPILNADGSPAMDDNGDPLRPADATPGQRAERTQRMWDYVRGRMHYGVLLHEMGHTIGLRHNFVSSFDKFNYRPQYWQLRTKDGTVEQLCKDEKTDPTGENCIGPRYYDPLTKDEVENSLYTWAQTTVMEYSGELTHDWLGLGIYDYAAARMFYGDVVDVRPDLTENDQVGKDALELVDFPGYLVPQNVTVGGRTIHYAEWNRHFGLLSGCREATAEELSPPDDWSAAKDGVWDPVFDGEIVHGKICQRPEVDYVTWRDLRPDVLLTEYVGDPQYFAPRRARTWDGRIRVPYGFASDEFRDGWSPSIQTRDAGADVYESTVFFLNKYENGHIWDNFRRNRVNFSIVRAYLRGISRTHARVANFVQGLSLLHDYYFSEIARNSGAFRHADILAAYEGEGGYMRETAVAASLIFDHFVRTFTRPQSGEHFKMAGSGGLWRSEQDTLGFQALGAGITIPNGTSIAGTDVTFGGRPLDNGFQYGKGYWYFDYIDQVGSFYEKTYAFEMMLAAYYRAPYAFSRWDGLDGRWRHTNFVNLFPEGMRRLMGIAMTEDWELLAPRVAANGTTPILEPDATTGNLYPAKPLGWVSFVPKEAPEVCWPVKGNYVCSDSLGAPVLPGVPDSSVPIEPQLGFETQKFLLFWAYVYQPSSQVMDFTDMMRLWKTGKDVDPEFKIRLVEWIDPQSGFRYFAKRYGDEELFGKTYDKGIAAKMIQWANQLTAKAYALDPVEPFDPVTGRANVQLDEQGQPVVIKDGVTRPNDENNLTCADNRWCVQLRRYRGLIDFAVDTAQTLGFEAPELPTIER